MLELLFCATFTILPDYLYRRYAQGKRLGREITFFTVWYELRWGITSCLVLTILLITLVFFYHPSSSNVTSVFRTVSILPEAGGRVAEVYVGVNDKVEAGQLLFRLDSTQQQAALETAQKQSAEVDAETIVAQAQLAEVDGTIRQEQGQLQQATDEYNTMNALLQKGSPGVSVREVDRLRVAMDTRQGALDAATANKETLQTKITSLLPAQKSSAEAAMREAQVAIDKTYVRAGTAGTLQQFTLRPGDVVNPLLRPAGILVPSGAGEMRLIGGFGQIESTVLKEGMIAEATCMAIPFTIVPMVVTQVQKVIAAGQIRPTDQLVDVQSMNQPGTITVFLEPLYQGQLASLPPGSTCIANAYTDNHDALEHETPFTPRWIFLHVIDTVGLVHAIIIRMQAALLPVQTLVLGGGH